MSRSSNSSKKKTQKIPEKSLCNKLKDTNEGFLKYTNRNTGRESLLWNSKFYRLNNEKVKKQTYAL